MSRLMKKSSQGGVGKSQDKEDKRNKETKSITPKHFNNLSFAHLELFQSRLGLSHRVEHIELWFRI